MLHVFYQAQALILRAPNASPLEAGAIVEIVRLDHLGV